MTFVVTIWRDPIISGANLRRCDSERPDFRENAVNARFGMVRALVPVTRCTSAGPIPGETSHVFHLPHRETPSRSCQRHRVVGSSAVLLCGQLRGHRRALDDRRPGVRKAACGFRAAVDHTSAHHPRRSLKSSGSIWSVAIRLIRPVRGTDSTRAVRATIPPQAASVSSMIAFSRLSRSCL